MVIDLDTYKPPYPGICIRPKTGEMELIGGTAEQNEEFRARVDAAKGSGMVQKMQEMAKEHGKYDKVELENMSMFMKNIDGMYVLKRPMPVNAIGLTPNDNTNSEKISEVTRKLEDLYRQQPLDKKAVKELFLETFEFVRYHLAKNGYSSADNKENMLQAVEDTYHALRITSNIAANNACYLEGKEKYPIEGPGDTQYYHADYYYKAQDVMAILEECTSEIVKKYELGTPDLSKRPPCLKGDYESFNSCWSRRNASDSYAGMTDFDTPPPKGLSFVWQFQEKGSKGLLEVRMGKEVWRSHSVFQALGPNRHSVLISEMLPNAGKGSEDYRMANKFLGQVHLFTPMQSDRLHQNRLWYKFGSYE